MREQPFAHCPVGHLVRSGKADMKQPEGRGGPRPHGLSIEGGAHHRLQEAVDVQAVGDHPDERIAA